ncbi:hypothetical protein J7M23_02750, partial [Candidatus Sumerlaeota bacterium]|nr:hypothetical protein [Candidatus Sumerlaeota bacterium]
PEECCELSERGSLSLFDYKIETDISAGTSIFYEKAPFVGSKVEYCRGRASRFRPLSYDYQPSDGDILRIKCELYKDTPAKIIFENKYNGVVTAVSKDGKIFRVARVLKPVVGIGRFQGSIYAGLSRVRANHPGVICISTVRKITKEQLKTGPISSEHCGGIQIIPAEHAMDKEMVYARSGAQWMVVSSLNDNEIIAGTPPLFSNCIKPGMRVFARFDDYQWEPFPVISGKHNDIFLPVPLSRLLKKAFVQGLTGIMIELNSSGLDKSNP